MSNTAQPRSVYIYALKQALFFGLGATLIASLFSLALDFDSGFGFGSPAVVSAYVISIGLGVSIGYMWGLGIGYAKFPDSKYQHSVIIAAGILCTLIVLLLFSSMNWPLNLEFLGNDIERNILRGLGLSAAFISICYFSKQMQRQQNLLIDEIDAKSIK